jgi:hypothetical protein
MRALFFIPVLSALSLVFAGCATPPENPQLLQARSLFSSLQEKPESNTLAAVETRIASNALDRANQVSLHDRTDPQIDQLAYLATQKKSPWPSRPSSAAKPTPSSTTSRSTAPRCNSTCAPRSSRRCRR